TVDLQNNCTFDGTTVTISIPGFYYINLNIGLGYVTNVNTELIASLEPISVPLMYCNPYNNTNPPNINGPVISSNVYVHLPIGSYTISIFTNNVGMFAGQNSTRFSGFLYLPD